MNTSYYVLFLCTLIFNYLREGLCTRVCCEDNSSIIYPDKCKNGSKVSVSCPNGRQILLNNAWTELNRFQLAKDAKGDYLEAYGAGYIVREPYFCMGSMKSFYTQRIFENVAIVCLSARIMYYNIDEALPEPPFLDRLFPVTLKISNALSALFFAITVFVYGLLKDLHDSQGTCIFHFSACGCFLHGSFFYFLVFDSNGLLPEFCITNIYLQVYIFLAFFIWCSIMNYNSWTRAKNQDLSKDDELITMYKYIGYGVPAVIILLCNLFAHAEKLYTSFSFAVDCANHQGAALIIFTVIPVILLSSINCFFYVDMQKRLWNSPTFEMSNEKSTLKIMNYRMSVNGKLFFIMGIPWLLLIIFFAIDSRFEARPFSLFCMNFMIILVSAEGILITVVLVLLRKRTLKAISHTWGESCNFIPSKWKTVIDSEIDEEVDYNDGSKRVEFEKKSNNIFMAIAGDTFMFTSTLY